MVYEGRLHGWIAECMEASMATTIHYFYSD
jgi:hypothetical protein